jgi:predicted alpha/beta-fold hydrolase
MSLYMQGLMHRAGARGWRGLALNFRSCASPPGRPHGEYVMNRGDRLYHSGETGDLDWVVERLVARQPALDLRMVGVSLGGNVLLKWLGERGADILLGVRAAAAVSARPTSGRASPSGGWPGTVVCAVSRSLKAKALDWEVRHPAG